MRPLRSSFFGPAQGRIRVRYHNGTGVVTGSIIKQLSYNRYQVTDGSTPMVIRMAETAAEANAPTAGIGYMNLTLAGSGATLAAVLGANAVAIQTAGTGYAVGNTITLTGGTGTSTVLTVTSIGGGGAITGVSITTVGAYTALPGTVNGSIRRVSTTTTNGGGSGAVFDLSFRLVGVNVTGGGSNYIVGQTLTFTGAGTGSPAATITSVSATGAITGITVTTASSGMFNVPTVAVSATMRVRRLMGARAFTVEGAIVSWSTATASATAGQIELIP